MVQHKKINVIHHINRIREKHTHMIISTDAKKVSHRIQCSFMKKPSRKLGIEGDFFNMIKDIYEKPVSYSVVKKKKMKALPVRSRIRQEH